MLSRSRLGAHKDGTRLSGRLRDEDSFISKIVMCGILYPPGGIERVPTMSEEASPVTGDRAELTPQSVRYMVDVQNRKQVAIAAEYGVSKQYVSRLYNMNTGIHGVPLKQRVNEFMPFHVENRFTHCTPYRRLRQHLTYTIDRSSLDQDTKAVLVAFYERISSGYVIEFNPDIEPHRGVATGGFAWRGRDDSDGDLIIRENHLTGKLSDQMRAVWRLPLESEWP